MSNWRRGIEQNEAAVSASTKRSGGPSGLIRLSKPEESGSGIRRSDINLLGVQQIWHHQGGTAAWYKRVCRAVSSGCVGNHSRLCESDQSREDGKRAKPAGVWDRSQDQTSG